MSRYKELDVPTFRGIKRVRVAEEDARARKRNGEVSVWGRDLSRGPADDLILVFLPEDDWDSVPWVENGAKTA
jgi:hypothetical protein